MKNLNDLLSPTSLTLSISIVLVAFYFWYNKSRENDAMLPPGNQGWPVLGETLEFIRSIKKGKPQKFILDRMTKYSPDVFATSLMGEKVAVFCGAVGNKCLFSSDDKFVKAWWPRSISKILISPENKQHDMFKIKKELRRVAVLFLKPEVLQKTFVGIMDSVSKGLIEKNWAPHQNVLAYNLAKDYTFGLACKLFITMDDLEEVAKFESLLRDITKGMLSLPINFPGTTFNRAVKSSLVYREEFVSIIKQRKKDLLNKTVDNVTLKSQDMLSQMLLSTYDEDGEFPSDLLVADTMLAFFIAGHDTTSIALTFMIKYLAELPHVYNEVLKEQMEIAKNKKQGELLNWEDIQKMKYSWNVAYEVMRLAPPAQGSFREVTTEFTCANFTIPKGWKAYSTVHSTNRNPNYFKNPEMFDPTRFESNGPAPFSFVPFGGGTHICPGREYARIEILVFIHNLVTQFKLEKLNPNEKIVGTVGAVPADGLPIRLYPRDGRKD